jgi:hypothetical protein
MNEAYAFTIILIAAAVIAVVAFIVGVIIKYKQDKENATKKKVYISTLVLTYCGVGTDLMNKKRLYYKNYTEEEAKVSYKKLQTIGEQTYQKLDTISDTDIFNFADVLVIHKNQFIAIEIGTHEEYE